MTTLTQHTQDTDHGTITRFKDENGKTVALHNGEVNATYFNVPGTTADVHPQTIAGTINILRHCGYTL